MSDINNETRAHRADEALSYYVQEQLGETVYSQESLGEHVTDLLSDLMHFCQSKDIGFDQCLRMAKFHYEAEKDVESKTHADCTTCDCEGKLELVRTEVVLGVTQEVYECEECDNRYVRDTSAPDSKLEYAVPCCMCHNVVPKSSAHLISEKDGYGHFIGECCWDERLRD